MGKHRGRGPTTKRSAAYSGDSFVVVNPLMLHSTACKAPIAQQNGKKKQQKQSKKRKVDRNDSDDVLVAIKRRKKMPNKMINNVKVSNATKLPLANRGEASCTVLRVKKDTDVLAGLVWILYSRNTFHPCVVAFPNHDEISCLASILKHLGLQAVALHHKMAAKQRNETMQRFQTSVTVAPSEQGMVLVTTEHMMAATASGQADVVLIGSINKSTIDLARTKFAHVYHVTATTGQEILSSDTFQPELTMPSLQQLHPRLKVARQIVEISQRLTKTGAADRNDEKWARKLARGADLDNEETKKTKRVLTPDEQRLQALMEKLYVMLARKLTGTHTKNDNMINGKDHKIDHHHRREKLDVLGIVTVNAVVGTIMTEERKSAQTRWMDYAEGRAHGGHWEGAVRHGASKDATSLVVRNKLCAAHSKANHSSFLSKWFPNEEPNDEVKWGGAFGKVCGHNEVVLNELRAFYPQEVLNSKVCSRIFPAPGNQGFDGCLEHLRYACMAQRTSMTLWDAEYFIFISSCGRVTWSKKNQLLSLSLSSLQCLVPALRCWTVASGGHIPPSAVLRAIQLCCQLGYGDKHSKDAKITTDILKRIMSFVFGGSARLWRQIAKVPTPLEEETVYAFQQ
ncbi:putative P-loop containing nucleoside triphosphate hydrolase [Plasmopara halstedii]